MSEAPRQSVASDSRPLVILDVDETLIHGTELELGRPANFQVGRFFIYKRPYLAEFLDSVSKSYAVAIWSSATIDYVCAIATKISSGRDAWQFVWGRDRCTARRNFEVQEIEYIKDLKKVKRLGFDLDRVLFVDDTAAKLSRNFGNAIYVAPFVGDESDRELPLLAKYLDSIRDVSNYRDLEKRGWRSHAAKS